MALLCTEYKEHRLLSETFLVMDLLASCPLLSHTTPALECKPPKSQAPKLEGGDTEAKLQAMELP